MANTTFSCDENDLGLPNDFMCPGNQVCFAKYHTWNTKGVSFCGCSTWFGFQGENCETLGIPAILSITWAVLLGIAYFLSCIYLLKSIMSLHKKGKIGKNALTKTYMEVIVAGFMLMMYELFNALSTASPAGATQKFGYYPFEKFSQFQIVHRVFLTIGFVLSYAGYSSMSLVWYDIASKSLKMTSQSTRTTVVLRYIVFISQVIFFAGIVYFYSINQYSFLAVWVSLFMLILASAFFLSSQRMKKLLKNCIDSSGSEDLKLTINRIIITSQVILTSVVIHVIFGASLIVVLFHDWREYWVPSPNQYLSIPLMLSDIEMGSFCLLHVIVSWYLVSIDKNPANSKPASRTASKERPLSADLRMVQSSHVVVPTKE